MYRAKHDSRTGDRRSTAHRRFGRIFVAILGFALGGITLGTGAIPGHAQEQASRAPGLTRVAAGTLAENPKAARWNAVVLLARPRIASGDVDSLPTSIRTTVSSFVLSILATVEKYTDTATGDAKFRLKEVGAGYSMNVEGVWKVVTLDDYAKLGLQLGFFERQMLSENERQLATVRVVARTSTITVFDAPAILLNNNEHRDFTIRHFVWIDSRTGKNSTLVWLLRSGADGQPMLASEALRWLPSGTKEDRAIHVDSELFLLGGIPTERAFALEDLPPGKAVAWTDRAKAFAAQPSYDFDALRELTLALNEALQSLKKSASSTP